MIPGYVRQVGPQYRGQQYAGAADRASAGIGQAIAGVGEGVSSVAQIQANRMTRMAASQGRREAEEWLLQYQQSWGTPEKRKELWQIGPDPITGEDTNGYTRELDTFGDAFRTKIEEIGSKLSPAARDELQVWYNYVAPNVAEQTTNLLMGMERNDVVKESMALAKQGRAADALEMIDLYQDLLGPETAAKLSTTARVGGAQADLQEIARTQGWPAAQAALKDPAWQQVYGLDVGDAASIRADLAGFVNEEAAIDEAQNKAVNDANAMTFLVAAEKGEVDLAQSLELVSKGELPYNVYEQGRKLMTQTAADRVDDPDTFFEAERWLTKVRQNPAQKNQAIEWLHGKVASLPQTWKTFAGGYEKAGDPTDPMGSPTVKLLDGLLEEHFRDLGTFGDPSTPAAERAYIDAKLRFNRYLTEHPTATDEEIRTEYDRLTALPAAVGLRQRISDSWLGWLTPGPGPTARMSEAGRQRYGYSQEPQATLTDSDAEPLTQQAFEDAVKSLPRGSKEQTEYYRRWAGKWQ